MAYSRSVITVLLLALCCARGALGLTCDANYESKDVKQRPSVNSLSQMVMPLPAAAGREPVTETLQCLTHHDAL
jgi:hypothetical protein